jgi:deoxycytidylate deaminase
MTTKKRVDGRKVPNRHEKYMGLAFWYASFSKDPSTQCGAVIINEATNKILGAGYNGPPSQYNDDLDMDWDRSVKYFDVIHSEINAIDHVTENLNGAIIYVTGMPCKDCMLDIVRVGIRKVVYFKNIAKDPCSSTLDATFNEIAVKIARKGKVVLEEFKGNLNWMRDRIKWMEAVGIFD